MRPQIVMTTPILEGIDARVVDGELVGKKMSKSADNYVGLTEPPLEMFRKCMQIDDAVIWRFFELLSAHSTEEIEQLRGANDPIFSKSRFAREIVTRFHDEAAASAAEQSFRSAYLGDGVPPNIPKVELSTDGATLLLAKALSTAGLVNSTSEGRRLIQQGGVEVDGVRVTDAQRQLERGSEYLVRVGSKRRRFCRVRVVA